MTETDLYLNWSLLFIDFLKIIFSLPVVSGAVLFYFLFGYKNSLEILIGRLSEGSFGSFKIKLQNDGFQERVLEELHSQEITVEEEKRKLLNYLIDKCELNEVEAEKYLQSLSEIEDKLVNLKLTETTLQTMNDPELSSYLYEIAKRMGKSTLNSNDPLIIQRFFMASIVDMPQSILNFFYNVGIVDGNSQLTKKGIENLKAMALMFMCKKCTKYLSLGLVVKNVYDNEKSLCTECTSEDFPHGDQLPL